MVFVSWQACNVVVYVQGIRDSDVLSVVVYISTRV